MERGALHGPASFRNIQSVAVGILELELCRGNIFAGHFKLGSGHNLAQPLLGVVKVVDKKTDMIDSRRRWALDQRDIDIAVAKPDRTVFTLPEPLEIECIAIKLRFSFGIFRVKCHMSDTCMLSSLSMMLQR